LTLAYLLFLHALVVVMLVQTDFAERIGRRIGVLEIPKAAEPSELIKTMIAGQERMDRDAPEGSVLFIGDSITQNLCVWCIWPDFENVVNFGIQSDTTVGVLKRLPRYRSLAKAKAVILAIGANDLHLRPNPEIIENYDRIIAAIPKSVPVVVSAVLPVDERAVSGFAGYNARILELNAAIRLRCSQVGYAFFNAGPELVDKSGNLAPQNHIGDGIHLSPNGYRVLVASIKRLVDLR
jgi:hypothetical protein